MLAPPPKIYLSVKNHCKLRGTMKHLLFTTLLAMVFDTVFLLLWPTTCHNKRRKLHEFGGATRTLGIEPGTSRIRGQTLTN